MDNRSEIREYLASRRAKITPAQAGLPAFGGNRRLPGLRREEVAMLAGVSVDYYTRLERGNFGDVSPGIWEAIARALQLDEAEREHLLHLAQANSSPRPRRRSGTSLVRPTVQRILDAITDAPAMVRNTRRDLLASNALGGALYSDVYLEQAERPVNLARYVFLSERSKAFFPDWSKAAGDMVANLRHEAGRDPYDKGLTDLVGELSVRSEEFRRRWAAHNVRFHNSGVKNLHHPVVGDLTLTYEAMELPADPGLSLTVYGAEPGSSSADALRLLASWASSRDAAALAVDRPATAEAEAG
ncbi:Helix-turn-helix domain-containing protein [Microbacterium sp. cf046]|uniref:helix-turn-helix transcriptional regulator n=1 Tax=Microbacterium sp. cf046 TaxID=1761803 RepID=UPI0008E39C0C|nr:helix-turn-helix transcriptional regulator [Microbacterium sp. cf046]SFS14363.1 Helix-turn-helix domain-containing protein [Microbacterium sp. cf046]